VKRKFLFLIIQYDPLIGKPLSSGQIIIFFALFLTTSYLEIGSFRTGREGKEKGKISFSNQFFPFWLKK
jgi:hypothetical protein